MIWVLNGSGMATGDVYYWLSEAATGTTSYWSVDGATPMDLTITAGEGFYLYTESQNVTALIAGQVKVGPYSKDLQFGYNLTGNFSPVPMDIQNIKLEGVDGLGTDMVWVLNASGMATGDVYYWLSEAATGTTSYWSIDGSTPMEKTLQPGEGLYLYTESTTGKITLPAVITK